MVDSKLLKMWDQLPAYGKYALGGIGILGTLMLLGDGPDKREAEGDFIIPTTF